MKIRSKIIDSDSETNENNHVVVDVEEKKRKINSSEISRKKKKISSEDVDKSAYEVISEMKRLYLEDEALMNEGKPATIKIDNVEDISRKVLRKDVDEACIKMGILKEVKLWLEPLKDGSLPNPKVKKVLLQMLENLKVRKNDLLNSGIGKIVYFYYRNKHELKDIRKEARNIVKKWKNAIMKEELGE